MTAANFATARAFVWQAGFDSPRQGYHITPGDPGGGTLGGVIEATWANAVRAGLVTGTLEGASDAQLSLVLQSRFWGKDCDALPTGLDLLLFNGRMMSGRFPWLFQQACGFMGPDLDGWIGPETLVTARSREPETFIDALCGAHCAYLSLLPAFQRFGDGWTNRIKAVRSAACNLADAAPVA